VTDKQGLKWDGTVSAGSIIAAIAIMVPVVGTGYVAVREIADIQRTMEEQGVKFDERLGKVETAIGDIRTDLAVKDGVVSMVNDHEQRIRELERRR